MKWIEISIITHQDATEAVSELLMNQGAGGVELVDPQAFRQVLENNRYLDYADDGFIESYGSDVIAKAYFSEDRDPVQMTEVLRQALTEFSSYMNTSPGMISWKMRDDAEWKDTWKDYYKPFKFTERIVIRPSWEAYSPAAGESVIEMDPGMAFGTGTHETTRMCALLGEKYIQPQDSVLDLGCGTAILALTAVKLGASRALAVDIDDAAVKVARQNIRNNGEEEKIQVRQGMLEDLPAKPYDLIFINIIADVILSLAPAITAYVGPGSRVILSGIIKGRRDEVCSAYVAAGLHKVEELVMGEWVAMVFHA